MADCTKHIYAKLAMHGQQIKDFVVDNREELPPGIAGQMAFMDGHLRLHNGTDWVEVSDEVILLDYQTREEENVPGGYLGIEEDGKVLVRFLPTGNSDGRLPLLKGEIRDGQSLRFSEEDGGFVAFEISTLYTYRGTCTSRELDLVPDPRVGDVWNLTDSRIWNGHNYVAGTSWAWEGTEWEPLAGSLDLSGYQLVSNMAFSMASPDNVTYPSTMAVVDYIRATKTPVIQDWSAAADTNVPSSSLVKASLDRKTDVTMAVPPWDPDVVYTTGSTVTREQAMYISIQPDNVGVDPLEDAPSDWWIPIQTESDLAVGSVRSVTHTIGNDTDTVYEIYHGFSTWNVTVTARTNTSPSRLVRVFTEIISSTDIRVTFTEPPGRAGAVITVMAITEAAGGDTMVYTQAEPSTEWVINHNFGTWCMVQVYGTDGDQMQTHVIQSPDLNTVTVGFGSPKKGAVILASAGSFAGEDVLSGSGRMKRVKLGAARMLNLSEASGTWVIEHNKGRLVLVQIYGSDGDEIKAEVIQDMRTLNSVTVRFTKTVSGTAVIL